MSERVCTQCGASAPPEHRFCGRCGGRLAEAMEGGVVMPPAVQTREFGGSDPPRAKLVLIKGEGVEGISYPLPGEDNVAGRVEGSLLFPEDPLLSPRHANFRLARDKLVVQDLASANGVYVRIKAPAVVASGGLFLVGEQVLQVDACAPDVGPQTDADGTCFYASPKRPSKLQLTQRLRGGHVGMVYRARADSLTLGREGNDLDFPDDPFISGHHARIACDGGSRFLLTDLGSKNGTFVRIHGEAELVNGDFVFLGQQLLRVELAG
jgi:pSer/pThr/pTyr-binding forkhead associated (FHA) protein